MPILHNTRQDLPVGSMLDEVAAHFRHEDIDLIDPFLFKTRLDCQPVYLLFAPAR